MLATATPPTGTGHHELPVHEVVLLVESDLRNGLSTPEAEDRLAKFGRNSLPQARPKSVVVRFLEQFNSPLIYVLLAAGVVTTVLGEYVDASVIFGVVVINAIVGFLQESKAEAALDALRSMVQTDARVVRDGHRRQVPSDRVVPGDLVVLEAGDKVPADLRLVDITELQADESALTGESVPVVKDEVVLPAGTAVADRRNMVYSGTLVTSGSGIGIAVATGSGTEIGEIHRLVGSADRLATPLTRKLTYFSKLLTYVILGLAAGTFAIGVARGEPAGDMLTAAVALAVGAIPEGLPAAVTITLAIGVGRMARQRAVIRRLPAVETLGSTTVICTDKTGTLTENQMTVRALWTPHQLYEVTGGGYAPDGEIRAGDTVADAAHDDALRWTLLIGAGCNDARLVETDGRWSVVGDPTEAALLVAARKAALSTADYRRVATVPFSSERQLMATLHQDPAGDYVVLAKGGTGRILERCTTQLTANGAVLPFDAGAVRAATNALAGRGLRVLAHAFRRTTVGPDGEWLTGDLCFAGLQAMLDPARAASAAAVAACHTAGISVKMITGDHAATAGAIGAQLGLCDPDDAGAVVTAADLDALDTATYTATVSRASVFARVSPEQKLRLVQALQAEGHVVAMTGDGVNDAPALRQADIGIAMGRGGTEVAKEAADMVLTDDDFATIEAAVEEGRGVFDNLTKFIVWTLPTNLGEGLVILAAILVGSALPILPVQILWINMTTAVALGLMLAFEPKEAGIMTRPPRDPRRPLLTRALVLRVGLVSAVLVAGSWWMFEWMRSRGLPLEEARTAAMNVFVVVEAFYLFSCRSLSRPAWRLGLFSNHWVIGGVIVQAIGQAAITYLPVMNDLFGTAPIGWSTWGAILLVAAASTLVVGVDKRRHRNVAW